MECTVIHKNVRLSSKTGAAHTTMIEAGGAHNVDYASYCCHVSLNRLRQCLGRPDMSVDQLEGLCAAHHANMMRMTLRKTGRW